MQHCVQYSSDNIISNSVHLQKHPQTECSQPLGMQNRVIPDSKITASSQWDPNHGPSNARLNFKAGGGKTGAWSARCNDMNQWLKVDFGQPVTVTQIQTQGREDCCNQFVTQYTVSYSQDNKHYQPYLYNGREKVRQEMDKKIFTEQHIHIPNLHVSPLYDIRLQLFYRYFLGTETEDPSSIKLCLLLLLLVTFVSILKVGMNTFPWGLNF